MIAEVTGEKLVGPPLSWIGLKTHFDYSKKLLILDYWQGSEYASAGS